MRDGFCAKLCHVTDVCVLKKKKKRSTVRIICGLSVFHAKRASTVSGRRSKLPFYDGKALSRGNGRLSQMDAACVSGESCFLLGRRNRLHARPEKPGCLCSDAVAAIRWSGGQRNGSMNAAAPSTHVLFRPFQSRAGCQDIANLLRERRTPLSHRGA